jgi:alpha-glucosidase
VVNIHDNYRPTGFSRTYPNLLQQEGIAGDEEMPTATQSTIYPFTRFIAGAADHTYCFLDKRLKKTKAHQLALAAINFGPLQYLNWYDRPEAHTNRAEIEFWKEMPTVWDDTRVISGVPGEHIAVARRKGGDWWLGAVTNVDARQLDLALDFLPPEKRFTADIFEDAENKSVAKRSIEVTRETRLKLALRASGGAAIHLRAPQ